MLEQQGHRDGQHAPGAVVPTEDQVDHEHDEILVAEALVHAVGGPDQVREQVLPRRAAPLLEQVAGRVGERDGGGLARALQLRREHG